MSSISKGSLVRLNDQVCFTKDQGGGLQYPHTNYANDEDGVVYGFYKLTAEQKEAWRNSDAATGMTSSGETKLCPSEGGAAIKRGQVYTVLRARCREVYNYQRRSGLVKLLDTECGREVYVSRKLVEAV